MINSNSDEYLFGLAEVENFRCDTASRLRDYFKFIRENHNKLDGDIAEFGVFRGQSLIATALLLKELKSDKIVYGFDSFSGFPKYHLNDDLSNFSNRNFFDSEVRAKTLTYKNIMAELWDKDINSSNVSGSGDFSNTSKSLLEKKIDYFELDNVVLVDGNFEHTLKDFLPNKTKYMCVNIDCDLYEGYRDSLNYCWNLMNQGAYVHLDEYYSLKFPGGKIAVDEFCYEKNIDVRWGCAREGEFPRAHLIR